MTGWPEPTAGDIVWCHFPDDINPKPKPRPALILVVFDDQAPEFFVQVAYGTSQRTTALHKGEFAILKAKHPAAYAAAGLSYDTKFNLKNLVTLPFSSEWFSVPPAAPHGQNPKLGVLHPSLVRIAGTAHHAAHSPPG
ncbi:hypothetical protein ACVC7V_04895 [Hydrogenophaga sp. A37]|uniref:hypothetical protein n=1 Tax=Hydrogenophaga sp. A37 TaxID=1945864 RepID=UPI0009879215|nr:hypothetical protein [Hydrogenophaga sp. A37]OOG82364.1 hypothetical protein B0E41_15975 [Hydrogenophaga sp. A37]